MSGAVAKPDPQLDTSWKTKAFCAPGPDATSDERAAMLSLFFADRNTLEGRAAEAEAKRVCQRCPVQIDCLEYALAAYEHEGVWGGLNEDQRSRLRKHRKANEARGRDAWKESA